MKNVRPDIAEAIRLSIEILRIWNRITFRLANIDFEARPAKICLGKTETHEVCVEDLFVQLMPLYDLELGYQDPEYEIDLSNDQCYIRVDDDVRQRTDCNSVISILSDLDKAEVERRIKQLKMLKAILEEFLNNIEFVFGFNS